MPRRIISWGILFFSLAVILLGGATDNTGFSYNSNNPYHLPIIISSTLILRFVGIVSASLSLFFITSAFWGKWSDSIEKFVNNKIYPHGYLLVWFVYLMSYLNGAVVLLSKSPPLWVGYLILYPGFAFIWVILIFYFKELVKSRS